jgi:peptidoglycan-associated lipoprotein
MRKSFQLAALTIFVLIALAPGSGCKRKPVVPPTAPPPAPAPAPTSASAPTITLQAAPSTIQKGQSSTLTWRSSNASSVMIDAGVGNVEASGSRSVNPAAATTYTATATGPGGSAKASTRVTVTEEPRVTPSPGPALADSEFFRTRVNDIFFEYDRYDLRDDARATLNQDARALAERAGIRLTIEGHCDERGSEKYNLALGDRRANTAKEYLVTQGIGADRMDTISYGEERPIDPGHNEEAWAKNRRAHFVMK